MIDYELTDLFYQTNKILSFWENEIIGNVTRNASLYPYILIYTIQNRETLFWTQKVSKKS